MTNDISRSGTLIEKRYQKLVTPQIAASLIKSLMVFVDSLVAGRFIGMRALAAIALAAPIFSLDQMLHCLLGSGLSLQVSNAVGQRNRKKANRIVGATLIAVLLVYLLVFLPILIFIKPLLSFFPDDTSLVNLACSYMIPNLLGIPVFELMVCLEKSYLIDGNEKLFASRPVITSILNIFLDIVFVAVFHAGMTGLAVATMIGTLMGYCVTLNHGFSKNCTVHPDFTVIWKPAEGIGYIKENLLRGGTYAIDEGSQGIINTIICKLLSLEASVVALAAWGIFSQIQSIVDASGNGINNGASLLGGTLYSEGDTKGCGAVFRQSFRYNLVNSGVVMIATFLFAPQISYYLNIDSEALTECSRLLRCGCLAFVAGAIIAYTSTYFTVLQQYVFSYKGSIAGKILIILCVTIGSFFYSEGVFAGYAVAEILDLFYLYGFVKIFGILKKSQPEKNEVKDYSILLVPEKIVQASVDLHEYMKTHGYSEKTARYFALFVEEGCNLICQKNFGKKIHADIRICIQEDQLVLTIMDDGIPYDISNKENVDYNPDMLENLVLIRLADKVSYDRILSLNHLVVELQYQM